MQDGVVNPLTKIYSPNGKTADLIWGGTWTAGWLAMARARITISGTSITFTSNVQVSADDGTTTASTNAANIIYITRVVGYRGIA